MKRMIILLLILGSTAVPAFAQEDDQLATPPLVVQTQGALTQPLEGPVDPKTYVLGPSDEVLLILKGPETTVEYLRVFPEGNVILPNYGPFEASGSTLAEFRSRIRKALSRFYRNIEIECQLSKPREFIVYTFGEVATPKPVRLTALARLSQAIERAGGIKGVGSERTIEIREHGRTVRVVDLFQFWRTGDFEQNPTLREGQSIFVPLREKEVTVVGQVHRPGKYELLAGETAAEVLAYCGGVGPLGDDQNIVHERFRDGKPGPLGKFSIESADTVMLDHMDVLVVDNIVSYGGVLPVTVVGGGGRTGRMFVTETQKLREFVYRLGNLDPGFDFENAVLDRKTGEGLNSAQTPFNVRDVLAGSPEGEWVVRPGDVILIPAAETKVYVTGEVIKPGPIPFQPGLTAKEYISLAGGPSDRGSFGKLDIIAWNGKQRDGNEDSTIHRGDTIVVEVKTSKILGGMWVGLTSLTSLVLSIVALASVLDE